MQRQAAEKRRSAVCGRAGRVVARMRSVQGALCPEQRRKCQRYALFTGARRQEAEAQQQCAQRLAGVIEWLDAQADAEGPFFLGKQA
jgi:hypothetical protein